MPCLGNPLSAPPDLSSRAELNKPILSGARPGPELSPDRFELEPQLAGLSSDGGREEFRGNSGGGGGGGAIGKKPGQGPDPDKDLGSWFQLELQGEVGDGDEDRDGTERASEECGAVGFKCSVPFRVGAPKLVQCRVCHNSVQHEEKLSCSVRGCLCVFHLTCAKENFKFKSSKQFKCPQHCITCRRLTVFHLTSYVSHQACFLCNQRFRFWKCIRCAMACHDKCVPFPEYVVKFPDRPGEAICWRHSADWHQEKDVFALLPLPYNIQEFKIDLKWKEEIEAKLEPPPYIPIKRNIYLVKRKRSNDVADIGCTNCSSTECSDSCGSVHQLLKSVSLLQKLFQPTLSESEEDPDCEVCDAYQTEKCGWGVVAAESISEGDFVIEYVGEVIDDAMCERRLWDMKDQKAKNFYMCEINKNFVIDATFKGNASRFLNHSCAPNCKLEKWQVEGEVRVGVFASRSIRVGEALTYDYRFVQFGPEVECCCGAPNCSRNLGTTRKIVFGTNAKVELVSTWCVKRQRTLKRTVRIVVE
ncbi:histone-lysine N-methyltransferase ASHR3 [Striga asiatica]|uniref:Histone-lysine N-methyltransferase ASHR3 n=1 Tax=Striga asiatica TaxID=4170 RepID=A0A5A7Q3V1_STRAF|nr:histone-lysine N-methyltransferase ASHR3 [Striga asiatica]